MTDYHGRNFLCLFLYVRLGGTPSGNRFFFRQGPGQRTVQTREAAKGADEESVLLRRRREQTDAFK